jgi:hypothetical protein
MAIEAITVLHPGEDGRRREQEQREEKNITAFHTSFSIEMAQGNSTFLANYSPLFEAENCGNQQQIQARIIRRQDG